MLLQVVVVLLLVLLVLVVLLVVLVVLVLAAGRESVSRGVDRHRLRHRPESVR